MRASPDELPKINVSQESCLCCKCGCGEKLEPHGPNDRDDTHRGLQYEDNETLRREEFMRHCGADNRILLEHDRTCSIGQEYLTYGQLVRESIMPKSGRINYSCLNHLTS